jgi:hypothetical protein
MGDGHHTPRRENRNNKPDLSSSCPYGVHEDPVFAESYALPAIVDLEIE